MICPNINLLEWQQAVSTYDKDTALVIFDQLGGRVPSKGELNVLAKEGSLDKYHNQRVWDTNVAENLIDKETWSSKDNLPVVGLNYYFEKKAADKVRDLNIKYKDEDITFERGAPKGRKFPIRPIDERFVGDLNELHNLHITRNIQRADIAADEAARVAETESTGTMTYKTQPYADKTVFNKQDVIESLISDLHESVKEEMRSEVAQLPKDVFNEEASKAGYNSVGNYWVLHPVQRTDESRKLIGVTQEEGDLDQAREQMKLFQKVVPHVEMVLFDKTLPTIAQADPGGRTIRVNPDLLTKDAIGHEFGHILIDLLGGMSNPLIRKGRAQLEGKDVETAVFEAYPDLINNKDGRVDKEILATAVGLEIVSIFKEEEEQNTWMRWLIRFFRALRSKLGIEASVARQLAEKLVSGTKLASRERATVRELKKGLYEQGRPSIYTQHSRDLGNSMTLLDKMITEEEIFQRKGTLALQKKLDVLAKQGKDTKEYKSLEDMLPRMQNANPTKGIIQMIRFAVQSTKQMNDTYLAYEANARNAAREHGTQTQNYTAKLLSEWRTSVAAWDMLEDLRTMLDRTKSEVEVFGVDSDLRALNKLLSENRDLLSHVIDTKVFKQHIKNKDNILDMLLPLLDHAISVKNKMQSLYIEKGKELMVDFLFPFVHHIEIAKREEYEKEWRAFDDKKRAEVPMDKYIHEKILNNTDVIEQDTKDLILRELGKAEGDIGILTRYVDTILDSKDVISSALARTVFGIHEATRREAQAWYYKFLDVLAPLEKQLGRSVGMADEKFWGWILETDPKTGRPIQKIISAVPSQLIEDFNAYKEMVKSELYQDNNGKKPSDAEKRKLIRDWMDKNAKVDKEERLKAFTEFIESLHKRNIIRTDEKNRWLRSSKVTYTSSKTPLEEIFANQEAIEEVKRFERQTYWNFRELSPFYKELNKKWNALQAMRENGIKSGKQTDARVIFYDFISNVIDEAAVRLPNKYSLYNDLPSMMKGTGQRYRATKIMGMSKMDFLKHEFSDTFQKKASDVDRGLLNAELNIIGKEALEEGEVESGVERTALVNEANEPIFFLPIYYTQNLAKDKSHKMSVEDQSFDIASLYFNYLKMSIDFGNKSKVLAELEMTNYFINNRDVIRRDNKGNILIDAATKKLKKVGETLRDKAIVGSGKNSLIAAQVMDFMKLSVYGMEKDEEPDMNIFGFTLDRAKLLDTINGFTAINLLGVNFVAGIANVNLGEITQVIEAMAGQYVTLKNLKDATGYYYKNLGGLLTDIGIRRPRNIVSLLNDRFDTLSEEIDGKINLNSRFANLMKTNTLFFTSHSGEHYMQTRFMIAMLKNLRAYDAEGTDLGDMLSQISVDEVTNTLKVDEKVVNFTEEDQTDFSARMHRILASMHGEYSQLGKSALQRVALGRMAILFRKFIVPGFKRRWQGRDRKNNLDGINNLLGDYQEGYYRTFGHFAKLMYKDILNFKFEAVRAHGRLMTKQERANLIRFTGELSFLIISIIMVGLTLKMKGEDDDKDDWVLNNLAYQALRLRSELAFFWNPNESMKILRSPMASMSQLENVIKLFGQLVYPVTSGTFEFDVYERGAWKDQVKLAKTTTSLLPVLKQYYRIRDIGDQLSWFQQ